MGWSVSVVEVELPRAICLDCHPAWHGPVRMRWERAERDADRHRAEHVAEWERMNKEWDK